MSIVPKESVEVIAQSIGISTLSPEAALALAPDVEYRMREIMQEAIKCMRHSRRTMLTADDVDGALNLRNVEPVYGFASGGPLRFKRALGHRDLFYIDEKDVDLKDVIEAPLPRAPLDTAVVCHWLAIEGVQPAIPENAPVRVIEALPSNKDVDQKDGPPVDIKLPVKHVLSRELQLYFDKITELTTSKSDSALFKEALVSLATDSGLHPLVPYFTYFIADEVSRGLNDYHLLFAVMRIVWSLLQNPHVHIDPYLHQLMPSVVTCLVSKKLGNRCTDNHWGLRDYTAKLVALICKRFGQVYNSLQTRLTKTLLNTLLDPKRALTQHYGATQGLAALGPNVVRLLLLPNLEPYLQLLEPEMLLEKQKNAVKRHEAWRVYGALLRAAGQCVYGHLKVFPPFPSPPVCTVWRRNLKVMRTDPKKRKASTSLSEHESPLKKTAVDGPLNSEAINSSPSHVLQETTSTVPTGDDSDVNQASSSGQTRDDGIPDGRAEKKGNQPAPKVPAILNHIWKDELQSGRVVASLIDLFGESILPFIPAPELTLFL